MLQIEKAEFLLGATALSGMPEEDLPEIAFCGRSNVGKSTLLNRMVGRKQLARVGAKPGRTQEINFYGIRMAKPDGQRDLRLVDLPGFGYAKLSKEKRESLSRLTVEYLSEREQLSAVALLIDSNRVPELDELAVRDICFEREIPLLMIATKVDRLNQKERHKNINRIAEACGLETHDLVLSGSKTQPHKVWERVLLVL